jgi:hypothetical protein
VDRRGQREVVPTHYRQRRATITAILVAVSAASPSHIYFEGGQERAPNRAFEITWGRHTLAGKRQMIFFFLN